MSIGHAAKALGIAARMIRYQDQIGLVARAGRAGASYCVYSQALRLIRRGLRLGFTAERIAILLQLWRGGSNADDVRIIALGHVEDLQRRIAGMRAMVRALEHFTARRRDPERSDRPVLDGMAEDSVASVETDRGRAPWIGAEEPVTSRRRAPPARRV